jgi:hypothetical protein
MKAVLSEATPLETSNIEELAFEIMTDDDQPISGRALTKEFINYSIDKNQKAIDLFNEMLTTIDAKVSELYA